MSKIARYNNQYNDTIRLHRKHGIWSKIDVNSVNLEPNLTSTTKSCLARTQNKKHSAKLF